MRHLALHATRAFAVALALSAGFGELLALQRGRLRERFARR